MKREREVQAIGLTGQTPAGTTRAMASGDKPKVGRPKGSYRQQTTGLGEVRARKRADAEAAKAKKTTTPADPDEARVEARARTVPATAPRVMNTKAVGTTISSAHLKIIEQEGARLGGGKSGFVALLIRHHAGLVDASSLKPAKPPIELRAEDIRERVKYYFYVPLELVPHLDDLWVRLGGNSAASWIVHAVNDWVGLPHGLTPSA